MSPVEINVLLTQADRQAYLAAWTERMQARAASLSWLARCFQRPATPNGDSIVLGPVTLRFDTTGVRVRNAQGETLHQWSAIADGTATSHHLFLWQESLSALILPIRALPAGMSVSELQQRLDAIWTAARSASSAKPSSELRKHAAEAKPVSAH